VSGGTINGVANTTSYHSIAVSAGTVNVTPLTDLLVANLIGTATSGAWFAGLSNNPSPLTAISQAQVKSALANLSNAFSVLPFFTTTNNPITTSFTPNTGNAFDDMLSALQTAMTNTSVTHSTLLSSASVSNFTAPAALVIALKSAYLGTSSGSNTIYYQVNTPITIFNTTSISLTLSGSYSGNSLFYSVGNIQGAINQTFLGQAASISNTTSSITENGNLLASNSSANYFSVNPYKSLGSSSTGLYTVYANQAVLPTIATVGMIGNLDTGTEL